LTAVDVAADGEHVPEQIDLVYPLYLNVPQRAYGDLGF